MQRFLSELGLPINLDQITNDAKQKLKGPIEMGKAIAYATAIAGAIRLGKEPQQKLRMQMQHIARPDSLIGKTIASSWGTSARAIAEEAVGFAGIEAIKELFTETPDRFFAGQVVMKDAFRDHIVDILQPSHHETSPAQRRDRALQLGRGMAKVLRDQADSAAGVLPDLFSNKPDGVAALGLYRLTDCALSGGGLAALHPEVCVGYPDPRDRDGQQYWGTITYWADMASNPETPRAALDHIYSSYETLTPPQTDTPQR